MGRLSVDKGALLRVAEEMNRGHGHDRGDPEPGSGTAPVTLVGGLGRRQGPGANRSCASSLLYTSHLCGRPPHVVPCPAQAGHEEGALRNTIQRLQAENDHLRQQVMALDQDQFRAETDRLATELAELRAQVRHGGW